jgi:hypothetical protein
MQITINGAAELTNTQLITTSWFRVFGVTAQAGRLFTDAEEASAAPVAVISDRYWTRQFGRAASAINATILVNNTPRTIIGVAPAGFTGIMVGTPSDVWLPATAQHDVHYRSNASNDNADDDKPWVPQDGISWLAVIGRSPAAANAASIAAMTGVYQQVVAERAKQFENPDRRERALRDHLLTSSGARGMSNARQDATPALAILMGMVALVLVVACANLANLGDGKLKFIIVFWMKTHSKLSRAFKRVHLKFANGNCIDAIFFTYKPRTPSHPGLSSTVRNQEHSRIDTRTLVLLQSLACLSGANCCP